MKHLLILLAFLVLLIQCSYATIYYVSLSGNDLRGDGTSGRPWRTLQHAVGKVPANQGHTIKLLAGTFVENAYINVPSGVNIEGSGIGVTILKPSPHIYYTAFTWLQNRFLLNLNGRGGNQRLNNFTMDGASKQLYGGIIVNGRTNVLIEDVRVQYFYFTGIWLWNTTESRVTKVQLKDNATGSSGGASGSIILSNCERMEVDNLNVDEAYGQALDAVSGKMYYLKLHDNRFSVSPKGNWRTPTGQTVPNLAVEFFNTELRGCEVYNNYFDNNLSLVMDEDKFATPTGIQTVRVYNNVFDQITRAGGAGHAIELTVHDAEIDHNYIRGGITGIANWDASNRGRTRHNWKIHHNVFHDIGSGWPTSFIAMFKYGVNNAHIYNNTVESTGGSTVHFLEVNNGGVANNVRIENNLIIDSNTSYNWRQNQFLSTINGARFKNSFARNNFLQKVPVGALPGVTYSGNLTGDAMIQRRGAKPAPYFELMAGSPLIDEGVNLRFAYSGAGPDIGAFEYGGKTTPNPPVDMPQVAIISPTNNSTFEPGQSITVTATASRKNGTIRKVEFFKGTSKLGEDTTSPYTFSWAGAAAGRHSLTARATDQAGASASSSPLMVTIAEPVGSIEIPGIIVARDWSQMRGVKLENTTDQGGGQNVGYIDPGDWIDYKVNVTSPGKYTVRYRLASLRTGGTIQMKSGQTLLATTTFAATRAWQNWITVNATVNLKAGAQTLRLFALSGAFNINWIEFSLNADKYVTIPAKIKAKDYSSMSGVKLENTSDIGGGQNAGYIDPGDWMEYQVNAPAAGKYTVLYRVASLKTGGRIELKSGASTLASTNFGSTGAWQNWTTISASIQLPKGKQTLRLLDVSGIFNVNWIEFVSQQQSHVMAAASTTSTRPEIRRIFSPNNDGINDTWQWVDPEIDPTSTLVVYSSAGQVAYEADASGPTWDGTSNGRPLESDVYYYVIHHADGKITGALQVVR